eukprot:1030066_1
MKTKHMKIVSASPIQSHPKESKKPHNKPRKKAKKKSNSSPIQSHPKESKKPHNKPRKKAKKKSNSSSKLSPKKRSGHAPFANTDLGDDDYLFSPLSPLVISPRTIHRKSNSKFPNLRAASQSMSESDPLALVKLIKCKEEDVDPMEYNDLYYNTHSESNSQRNLAYHDPAHDINEYYIDKLDKYIQQQNELVQQQSID